MTSKKVTFTELINAFKYHYDLHKVFDDFLTMTICALSRNPATNLSYDEDLYLETIAPYKDSLLRLNFPEMFAALVNEMEERVTSHQGNDILGEYYELNLVKKNSGQFFTPWSLCKLLTEFVGEKNEKRGREFTIRILEPACGSGRMLMCAGKKLGLGHEYYGIDIDPTCVKMAAINLFLNGIAPAEIMCADALFPKDFRVSYVISMFPLGIFRITDKEQSNLWKMYDTSLVSRKQTGSDLMLPSQDGNKGFFNPNAPQLNLF